MIKCASLFSQMLKEMFIVSFERLVQKHGNDFNSKGFSSKTQLVAMLFSHLAKADSLRAITNGLLCCNGKLRHLGIDCAPKRSTLAYANEHRPAELYEDYFWALLGHFRSVSSIGCRKAKFRFKNKLFSFDSTTISLCHSLFPWASFRRAKGGVKVHVLLDHDDYMPSFVHITEARVHDNKISQHLNLSPKSIVAIDKGYIDFEQFKAWTDAGVYFVTRPKQNMNAEVVRVHRAVPQNRNIEADEVIRLMGCNSGEKYTYELRLVTVYDERKGETIELLTNNFEFGSTTISSIYKERWEIELFFKKLKQNLNVKTFIGTSENALRIQIWTAMIAMLLTKWLHHLSKAGWSFVGMCDMLRLNLFTYRILRDWLDAPYETPPGEPEQSTLPFGTAK